MKKQITTLVVILTLPLFMLSAQKKETKYLVTYFSVPESHAVDASTGASRIMVDDKMYGTTEYVAQVIAQATGGNLFEIKTKHTYPTQTHKALIDYAKEEKQSKTYPEIANKIPNIEQYDVIFVGYPNWWYDMPMVIYTLMREYDFSGKTIVPFVTHGGSGFDDSVATIQSLQPQAKVNPLPAISNKRAASSKEAIEKWLSQQGYTSRK